MDYDVLAAELKLPVYDGLSDSAAAELLNTKNLNGAVSAMDVKRYLHISGKWAAIKQAATNGSMDTQRAAIAIVDALADFEDFDLGNPTYLDAVTAQLNALVLVELLAEEDKNAILELGANKRSRAEQLGLSSPVSWDHIYRARA